MKTTDLEDLTIHLRGVELTARYRYKSGDHGDHETAPTYPSVEVIYVFAGEKDILPLLNGEDEEAIEEMIYRHKN